MKFLHKNKEKLLVHLERSVNWVENLLDLTEEAWRKPIAPGKWTIAEVICHLLVWDKFLLENRIPFLFDQEELPKGPNADEVNKQSSEESVEKSKKQIISIFISRRRSLIIAINNLPDELWKKKIKIGESTLLLSDYLLGFIEHDFHYFKQIKEVLKKDEEASTLAKQVEENERYPIGKYKVPIVIDENIRKQWINNISSYPARLKEVTMNLSEDQQRLTYRTGSWTVGQLVHHITDAQLNVFIRIKLALTEDSPTIKTYEENLWIELSDSNMPIDPSLQLIEGLHTKLTCLFESLTEEQFTKTIIHPELGPQSIQELLSYYVWHTNHHLAHIKLALEKNY